LEKECGLPGVFRDSGDAPAIIIIIIIIIIIKIRTQPFNRGSYRIIVLREMFDECSCTDNFAGYYSKRYTHTYKIRLE